MSRSILLVRNAALLAALVLLLSACQDPEPSFRPPAVEAVEIEVDCVADPIRFVVRPWAAWVNEGAPLRWDTRGPGVESVQIVPKDPERWPFDRQPPQRPVQPGTPIETGRRQPAEQGIYRYSILLDCGDRGSFDLDPDVIVNGDW